MFLDDKRGWFGLYHSRLIGGGVILKQRRVKSNGENNNESYSSGWTKHVEVDIDTTFWMYFTSYAQDLLFFSKYFTMFDMITIITLIPYSKRKRSCKTLLFRPFKFSVIT